MGKPGLDTALDWIVLPGHGLVRKVVSAFQHSTERKLPLVEGGGGRGWEGTVGS